MVKPGIHRDKFTACLTEVIKKFKPKTILDVGASDGRGSTSFFAQFDAKVYALELDPDRFTDLKELFKDNKKVVPYNYASSDRVMTTENIWRLYRRYPLWDCWTSMGIFEMIAWKDNSQAAVANAKVKNGIQEVKRKHRIKHFGLACLDGGEFCGEADLDAVLGAKIIAFDDVRGCKNFDNHKRMMKSSYILAHYDKMTRNGFSIFIKVK